MLTLNEFLKEAKDNGKAFEAAVLSDMLRQSKLLQLLPIKNVKALQLAATRWQSLPSTSTRKIGGSYTASEGKTEEVACTLAVYGGEISVDRILTKVEAKENPLTLHSKMKVASLMSTFNYDFINGDNASDPDTMEGVNKLVSNAPTRMSIDLTVTATGTGLPVIASATNEHLFIDALHEALHKVDAVNSGNAVILGNEGAFLGISKVLRRSGLLETTKDSYDRTWETFMGAKIIDVGLKADMSTEIITSTENATSGSSSDSTSLYVVRFGGEDGLRLAQLTGTSPEPYDPLNGAEGGAGAAPAFVRRIDWAIGLQQVGKYSIAKIKGVKFATS